jgi:sugar O-acyltransferase (sialic acid O-acetyltransferase NeuD family)
MNKNLLIIGARAMGREACNYAKECGFVVKGFLDSDKSALDGFDGYPEILDTAEDYTPNSDDVFVCAIGDPKYRQYYTSIMSLKGAKFCSIIHPTAYVGPNVQIGEGSIICPNATLTCDLTLGRQVIVNVNSSISHDCSIGDFCSISPGVSIAGRVRINNFAFLGVGVKVIPDVELASNVIVGAGAVVTKSCCSKGVTLVGVPAKPKYKCINEN